MIMPAIAPYAPTTERPQSQWVICLTHRVVLDARHCPHCGDDRATIRVVPLSYLRHETWRVELFSGRLDRANDDKLDPPYPDLQDEP